MDTPVVIKCREVGYERHRKQLVNLGGAENEGPSGRVRRLACHNLSSAPSVVAVITNLVFVLKDFFLLMKHQFSFPKSTMETTMVLFFREVQKGEK